MKTPQLRKLIRPIIGASVASCKAITVNVLEAGETSAEKSLEAARSVMALLLGDYWTMEVTDWGGVLIIRA